MKSTYVFIVLLLMVNCVKAQTANIPTDIDTPVNPVYTATYPSAYSSGTLVNWTRSTTLLKPKSDTTGISSLSVPDALMFTNYTDGLGRTVQTVAKQVTPRGFDMVTPVYYDSFGRNPVNPLPYKSLTFNYGLFKKGCYSDQRNFYDGMFPTDSTNPYSRTLYDDTSFYRTVTSMKPGATKVGSNLGKTVRSMLNDSVEGVRMWTYTAGSLPVTSSVWPKYSLFVTEMIDESGKRTREYRNKEGQVILNKIEISNTPAGSQHVGWLCTYYVYDDLYQLRYVITPKVIDSIQSSWTLTQSVSDALCYFYDYDSRGRIIQKKLPGQSAQYVIYDSTNRPVLIQTGNLAASNQWLFTKYDVFGRPIITGKFLNSSTLSVDTLRNQMASSGASPNTFVNFLRNNISINTYNNTSTISDADIYTINYFDDYSNTPTGFSYASAPVLSLPGGLNQMAEGQSLQTATFPTGSYVHVMNGNSTTSQWLSSVAFYDTMGRKLQVQDLNADGGYDTMSFQYDFAGRPLASLISENNPSAVGLTRVPSVRIMKAYTYDNAGRPLTLNQKINDEPYYRQIHQYSYDEMNNVATKLLGGIAERQDYSYKIWGDLEGINRNFCLFGINDNFFGEVLKYDRGFTTLNKTGLASGMQWRLSGSPTIERAYGYTYDAAGRLTTADYSQQDGTGWSNSVEDYTARNMQYDGNSNLLRMDQWGTKAGYSAPFQMDQLKYQYTNGGMSNQINAVNDSINTYYGLGEFQELAGSSPRDYKYDANGNITTDTNKNIASISYNYLNKPYLIRFTNSRSITFTYDATGNLLRKQIVESGQPTTIIDYLGNLEYKDSTLSMIGHEEGRSRPTVLTDASSDTTMFYEYDYFVKDHMGNVRSVITEEVDSNWFAPSKLPSGVLSFNESGYDPNVPNHYEGFTLGPHTYSVTNELSQATLEEMMFDNVSTTRDDKVGSSDQQDLKETRLNGSQPGRSIGPAKMLRVMAGDSIQLSVSTYFASQGQNNNTSLGDMQLMSNLLSSLAGGTSSAIAGDFSSTQLTGSFMQSNFTGALSTIESQTQINYTEPQAFLTYILLDDNMQVVPEGSGTLQSVTADAWNTLSTPQTRIPRNGYLVVYVSNTSAMDVAFDNLNIVHYKGKLLSENHYYPYGLTITSNAIVNAPDNNRLYTGKQLNHNEFVSGPGLDWYDYGARQYDPQIGAWHSPDPMAENSFNVSPYSYCFANPIAFTDPSGMTPAPPHEQLAQLVSGFKSGAPDGLDYALRFDGAGGGGVDGGFGAADGDGEIGLRYGAIPDVPNMNGYIKNSSDITQQMIDYAWSNATGDISVLNNDKDGMFFTPGGTLIGGSITQDGNYYSYTVGFFYHDETTGEAYSAADGKSGYFTRVMLPIPQEDGSGTTSGSDNEASEIINDGTFIPLIATGFLDTKAGKLVSMGGAYTFESSNFAGKMALAREAGLAGRFIKVGGRGLGLLGVGYTAYDMVINRNYSTSNTLDFTMGVVSFIPGVGWIIGGVYFISNEAVKATTGQDIGQHIDNYMNTVNITDQMGEGLNSTFSNIGTH